MKQHVTTVLTLALLVLFSIAPLSAQKLWENEPYGKRAQKNELIQLRDQFSKHFENEDGTITAHIAAGPIHYAQDGEWKTIYHSILPDNNGFKNTWNAHKTYYPKLANERIRTILPSGEVLYDMMDMRMYFDVAGSSVRNIQPQKGVADYNELTYSGVYGAGIDLRLTHNTMKRKMDYVLNDLGVLGAVPSGAEFLVFEEKVQLPAGWVAVLQNNEVLLKDDSGVVRAVYEKPVFMDTPQHNHDEEELHNEEEGHDHEILGDYEIQQLGELVTIKTKVPLEWLAAPHRAFPVIIDPTINLYPNNATAWSGYCTAYHADGSTYADAPLYSSSIYDAGFNDIIRVGRENTNYSYQGYVKFNIASLPSSCVNSVNLNYRVDYNYSDASACNVNVRLRHMSADPVANTWGGRLSDIRDGVIYETRQLRCYTTGSGWVSVPMTANLNQLEAAVPSGWFGVGMNTFEGGSHTTCYTRIRGYSSADRPYIAVDYRPNFRVEFSNPTPTNLCAGQTQSVSVTVTNTGCMPWTSGWTLPNTVNFSWWGSWQPGGLAGGQDNNPRMLPFTNLAPGASQVVTFNVTAPSTPGNYSIQTDLVRDAVCWFRGNGAPNCGPGNVDYVIPITVNDPFNVAASDDIATCGDPVVLNAAVTTPPGTFSGSASPNVAIPDNNSTGVSSIINVPSTCADASDVLSITLNIAHPFTGDLDISLIAPDGSSIDLSSDNGGSGDNYTNTIFIASAGTAITAGSAPFSGSFRPEQPFTNLTGSAQGNWTLNVKDDAGGDVGTFIDWTLNISSNCGDASYSWSPSTGLSSTTIANPIATPPSTTTYTVTATINGCSETDQVTVTVETPSTSPTTVTGGGNICHGTIVNLQATGGSPAAGAQTVWYQGGCNNAYTEPWMNTSSWDWSNSTTLNSVNGILNLTSTSNDPMISMSGLGSFDPAVYRYINVRYRVTAGTAGGMEIFFYNAAAPGAIGAHYTGTPLISDNQWHIATLDLYQNALYTTGGNITGWRYDWAVAPGVTMDLDFIQLSQFPMIDENTTDDLLTLTPGASYYPAGGATTTYASSRIDNCGATSCASTTVTLPAAGTTLGLNGESATCVVNQIGWVHFYHSSGRLIGSINSQGQDLGSVTMTVFEDGTNQLVPACDDPTNPSFMTSVMQRHWVVDDNPVGALTPNIQVGLPFYDTELASLVTASAANGNPTDNVAAIGDLLMSRYHGPLNVDDDALNNCPINGGNGNTMIHAQDANGPTTAYSAVTNASYSVHTVPEFSELWLHGQIDVSPLPVELTSFVANCDENRILVEWTTASELNADHYELERSRNGLSWDYVATIPAAGTTNQVSYYQQSDVTSTDGIVYYRLIQEDFDGVQTIYGPISTDCSSEVNEVNVYPNPTNDNFVVQISSNELLENVEMTVLDMSGKLVHSDMKDVVSGESQFYVTGVALAKGVYTVQIQTNSDDKTRFKPVKLVVN